MYGAYEYKLSSLLIQVSVPKTELVPIVKSQGSGRWSALGGRRWATRNTRTDLRGESCGNLPPLGNRMYSYEYDGVNSSASHVVACNARKLHRILVLVSRRCVERRIQLLLAMLRLKYKGVSTRTRIRIRIRPCLEPEYGVPST